MDYEGHPRDDGTGGGSDPVDLSVLEAKTQNIILPDTQSGNTVLNGNLLCTTNGILYTSVLSSVNSQPLLHSDGNFTAYGMQFSLDVPKVIGAVDIPIQVWPDDSTKYFVFYDTVTQYLVEESFTKQQCELDSFRGFYRYVFNDIIDAPANRTFAMVLNTSFSHITKASGSYVYSSDLGAVFGVVASNVGPSGFADLRNQRAYLGGLSANIYVCLPVFATPAPDTSIIQASDFKTSTYASMNAEITYLRSMITEAGPESCKIWSSLTTNDEVVYASNANCTYNVDYRAWVQGIGSANPITHQDGLVAQSFSSPTSSLTRPMILNNRTIGVQRTFSDHKDGLFHISCGLRLKFFTVATNYPIEFKIAVWINAHIVCDSKAEFDEEFGRTTITLTRSSTIDPYVLRYNREFVHTVNINRYLGTQINTVQYDLRYRMNQESALWTPFDTYVYSEGHSVFNNFLHVEALAITPAPSGLHDFVFGNDNIVNP